MDSSFCKSPIRSNSLLLRFTRSAAGEGSSAAPRSESTGTLDPFRSNPQAASKIGFICRVSLLATTAAARNPTEPFDFLRVIGDAQATRKAVSCREEGANYRGGHGERGPG